MGEGARLKRDMRVLGGEVEQAQDKARAANDDVRKVEVERDSLLLQLEDLRTQNQLLLSNVGEDGLVVEDVEVDEVDAVIAGGGGGGINESSSEWPVDGNPSTSVASATPVGNPFGAAVGNPFDSSGGGAGIASPTPLKSTSLGGNPF